MRNSNLNKWYIIQKILLNSSIVKAYWIFMVTLYAPSFEKVGVAYWFWPVCSLVHSYVCFWHIGFDLFGHSCVSFVCSSLCLVCVITVDECIPGSWNWIYGSVIKISWSVFFLFSCQFSTNCGVLPLFQKFKHNLVYDISKLHVYCLTRLRTCT